MVTARVAANSSSILFCRIGEFDELFTFESPVFASEADGDVSLELFSEGILNFSSLVITRSISLFVSRLDLTDRITLEFRTVSVLQKELTAT